MDGMIFDIEHSSFVDGPGIRTTVFFKGCNLRCAWCHNPESQHSCRELMVYADKCIGCGKCAQVCPNGLKSCDQCGKCAEYCPVEARKLCGRSCTVEELLEDVVKDKPFYDNSQGGVTCSGGECLLQANFVADFLKRCKQEGISTAVDTAGEVPFASIDKVLPFTDLFLYDVKAMDSAVHQQYVGVGNKRILENLSRLLTMKKRVWIRVPVIPGVNDSAENMRNLKSFLDRFGGAEKVELLPYHAMGDNKYRSLGRTPTTFAVPEKEKMDELNAIFIG